MKASKSHREDRGKAPQSEVYGVAWPRIYSDSCKNSFGLTHFSFLNLQKKRKKILAGRQE